MCENTAGHYLKLAMIEPSSLCEAKFLKDLHISHPQLEGDWLILGPNVEHLPETEPNNADSYFSYQNVTIDDTKV